jgi:hypothetical protein
MQSFNRISPILCHIEQKHVDKTIEAIAKQRVSSDKTKYNDWIDNVITYIKNQPYADTYKYTDYQGIVNYFRTRQTLTTTILPKLTIPHFNYVLDTNYDDVFHQLSQNILKTLNTMN